MNQVKTLESSAMDVYLSFLQDNCAAYVAMAKMPSTMLATLPAAIITTLKTHLRSQLHGMASSSLRQEMVKRVMSGKYPSIKYQNQYESCSEDSFLESESDIKLLEEIRQVGKKCNSICCTGIYIVETMLSIIVNEDIRELDFAIMRSTDVNFCHKNKLIKKYMNFQVPAVLAHYTQAVRDSVDTTTAKLRRLHVKRTFIPTRNFAIQKNYFEVLTRYPEMLPYLEIPGKLSSEGAEHHYGAYAEHLVLSLGEMFNYNVGAFPYLTELVLGREACNTVRIFYPLGRPSVTASGDHYFHTYSVRLAHFLNQAKKLSFQEEVMFTTVCRTVELAEWITYDSCPVLYKLVMFKIANSIFLFVCRI